MNPKNMMYLACSLLCACAACPPCLQEPVAAESAVSAIVPAKAGSTPEASQPAALRPSVIDDLLTYHQALRELALADLLKELANLNGQPKHPRMALQKSMVLSLTRNSTDLARALVLADHVAKSAEPDALPLKPLAQLLLAQFLELRRLSEQSDKSAQQVKDGQRRIEQLNDTLEALKAIERTLPARPAPTLAPPQAK